MANRRRKRRRLRVGRLFVLLLLIVLSIGIFAVFVSGMIKLVQEIFSPQEPEYAEPEPTPTPDPTYRNDYDWQYVNEDEAGFASYEDTQYTTRLGIDVSHYQGNIRPASSMRTPATGRISSGRWMRAWKSQSISSHRQTGPKRQSRKRNM